MLCSVSLVHELTAIRPGLSTRPLIYVNTLAHANKNPVALYVGGIPDEYVDRI